MAKLVFCEDDSLIRKLITVCLRSTDHVLHFANDGREGIQLVEHEQPDILFTDMWMPVIDGIDLWQHLRAQPAFARLPIVFVTGSGDDKRLAAVLADSATEVLPKPFTPAALRETIDRLTNARAPQGLAPER